MFLVPHSPAYTLHYGVPLPTSPLLLVSLDSLYTALFVYELESTVKQCGHVIICQLQPTAQTRCINSTPKLDKVYSFDQHWLVGRPRNECIVTVLQIDNFTTVVWGKGNRLQDRRGKVVTV